MKRRFFAAISFAVLLATVGCAPRVRWSNPVALTPYSTDTYANSNMLIVIGTQMALPEGWFFRSRGQSDPKPIMFWIHNSSGKVIGAYRFEHVDFVLSGSRVAERLAEIGMKGFSDITIQRTEIDNTEAYI